jgi:hypothetical protein
LFSFTHHRLKLSPNVTVAAGKHFRFLDRGDGAWPGSFSTSRLNGRSTHQYNSGWAVTFLALLVFWFAGHAGRSPTWELSCDEVGAWIALALLFPIRVLEKANPDWRMLSWLLALCVVGCP